MSLVPDRRSDFPWRQLLSAWVVSFVVVGVVLLVAVLAEMSLTLAERQTTAPLMKSMTEEEQHGVAKRLKKKRSGNDNAPAKHRGARVIFSFSSRES
jgi:hypothetical protein